MTFGNRIAQLEQEISNLQMELAQLRDQSDPSLTTIAQSPELKSLVEFFVDPILIINNEGVLIDANTAATELFGVSQKGLLSKSLANLLPQYWRNHLQPLKDGNGSVDAIEMQLTDFTHPDGSVRHVECRAKTFFCSKQHVIYLRDVTHQMEVEQAAHLSDTSFKTLAANIPDNITQVDLDLNYTYVNPAYAKRLNMKSEDMIGKPSSDYSLHPNIRDQWVNARRAVIASGEATSIEFSLEESAQDIRTFHALLVPEFGQNGEVESVLSVSREVTEYKIILDRLQENMAFVQRISDISPYMIFVYDAGKNELIFTNPVANEYLTHAVRDTSENDMDRRSLRAAFHPDDLVKLDQTIQQDLYEHGEQVTTLCCRFRHNDDWRLLKLWLTIFNRLPEQSTVQILGVAQDITEQERAEKQALQLAIEQERNNLLTGFIRSISHEFRTPLASISMTIFLLEHVINEESSQYLERIQNASGQISALIDGMLQLLELDTLRALETESCELSEIVLQVVENQEKQATQKQITLETQISDQLPYLRLNQSYISDAITQLVENAIRYTPENGKVKIRVHATDGDTHIIIQDNGIGIPKEFHKQVFERFYRLDDSRTVRGLGLGLPIVQRIAELHGGSIELESIPDEGSTFIIKLPVSPLIGAENLTTTTTDKNEQ